MKSIHIKKHENITLDSKQHDVTLTGPLGKVSITLPKDICLTHTKNMIHLSYYKESNLQVSTYKSILKNLIKGLSIGYIKILKLSGLGYKAHSYRSLLYLKLGNSHTSTYRIPNDILCKTVNNKYICLIGINPQRLNQIAHQIKKIKKLDVYKGKGILEKNQPILLRSTKKK